MAGRMQTSEEKVKQALEIMKEKGSREASRFIGVDIKTVQRWASGYTRGLRSQPKSVIIEEMADLIRKYGMEISQDEYDRRARHPKEFRKHWASYIDFRNEASQHCPYAPEYNRRIYLEVKHALLLIGSDAHYWPYWGASTAHRALLYFSPILKPTHIILNGDVPDFPQITHHRPIAWKKIPDLRDEFDEISLRIGEIINANRGAEKYWTYGNHCIRYDNRLAERVPEYADISGMRLSQHFPEWKFQNAIRINEDELEIKHRYRGGELATRNNVIRAGINYLTGHDHNRQIYRWKDLRGTRYGINPGLMADPWGPQFEYNENHPANHDSGLAVITFENEVMMPPELIEVVKPGKVWFRGRMHEV